MNKTEVNSGGTSKIHSKINTTEVGKEEERHFKGLLRLRLSLSSLFGEK
jgi:hypothetical protein